MHFARLALVLLWIGCGPLASALFAQEPLELRLAGPDGGVEAVLGRVLSSTGTARSLESGLPIRLRVVVELWRDQLLDAQDGRYEWRATVRQDPLSSRYLVETAEGELGDVLSPAAAREFLQGTLDVPLRPGREGRFYYLGRIEIETLSVSDLEELRRWLRGDVSTDAAEGAGSSGSFLGRGFRRLLVRALGLPVERHQARTPAFEVGG